jgi:hypothetical protein
MAFDISSLSRLNDFYLETKAFGQVLCGSVNIEMSSKLGKMLKVSDADSIDFIRQLLHLICKKTMTGDTENSSQPQENRYTDDEIRQVSDDELETFAQYFIAHNGWLLHDPNGNERKVRTNDDGERVVSHTPKISDIPKDDDESYSKYLIRLYRKYFADQKDQLNRMVKAATGMAVQQSALVRFSEVNRYMSETSAIADMAAHVKREQEMMRAATYSFEIATRQSDLITQSAALAKTIYHDMDLIKESARQCLTQSVAIPNAMIAEINIQREVTELLRKHESMFRLPQGFETVRLIDTYQLGAVAKLTQQHAQYIQDQQIALKSITTPWLHKTEAARSVTAFLELQGIGNSLKMMKGFDPDFTAALRQDFGDWRDKITFPEEVFIDPVARVDFYVDRGFNSDLTDFPEAAFHQSLNLAGLDDAYIDLELYGSIAPRSADPEEEAGLQRTNMCHDRLQRFERRLRQFIDNEMTTQYGTDWPKRQLPPKIYEGWVFKKQQAENNGAANLTYIELADFSEYETIICKKDNWRDVFAPRFKKIESVRESLQRLQPIRKAAMHARIVTKEDELFLIAEIVRLIRAFE